jgi:precorrin-2 dehydrogenase/sirohydrochlorin ferrochelatase
MGSYPVCLELAARPAVVVGGDVQAEEKVRGLLAAGAVVTVVAPALTAGLGALAASGRLAHRARRYQLGDLEGAFLAVVVDRSRPELTATAFAEARARGVLINTVDDAAHCDFIAPAVVRRGELTVAISTGGKAPALAVRLRQRFERELGEEHARFLEWAGSVRERLAALHPDFEERRSRWYRLVDSDVLALLRGGDEAAAARRFEDLLGVRPIDVSAEDVLPNRVRPEARAAPAPVGRR